jgi:predicted AlkP superfamily phosphohydrolase/phosphomutase
MDELRGKLVSSGDDGRPARQLVIGLDAMEWTLVEKWAAAGGLPTFRRLMREGLQARLITPADSLPDMVWTTFSFGVNPGKVEKYFYVQYDPVTARLRYAADSEMRGTPFWEYLSRAGRRIGVVDVPHLPFREIDGGFVVMNWGAHDNKGVLAASPRSLIAEIRERFGAHPVGDCEKYNQGVRSRARLRRDILRGIRAHGELFRWLMATRPWDMFLCSFPAAHCAGHHFWADMDKRNLAHPASDPHGFADTIEQTYRAIDHEVGEMIALAGDRTRVVVFALHGMAALSHASWNLNEILEMLGYGARSARGTIRARAWLGRVNPWRLLKKVAPAPLQYAIKERLPKSLQDYLLFLWYAGGQTSGGRRALAVPNNEVCGAIRIGVQGRDRGGVVEPGPEYERLCDEITAALGELTDPVTGRPVVRKVTRLHQVCWGPFVEHLPDLAVLWESRFSWSAVHSPRFGMLRIHAQDRRTGSHTPSSFLLAAGPGVPAGAALTGGSTLDIAPTVLELAGVPPPAHFDGKPLSLTAPSALR